MQCPSCLCSASQEVVINSVKYLECDFCGNLISAESSDRSYSNDKEEELKMLREQLKVANDIINCLKTA